MFNTIISLFSDLLGKAYTSMKHFVPNWDLLRKMALRADRMHNFSVIQRLTFLRFLCI